MMRTENRKHAHIGSTRQGNARQVNNAVRNRVAMTTAPGSRRTIKGRSETGQHTTRQPATHQTAKPGDRNTSRRSGRAGSEIPKVGPSRRLRSCGQRSTIAPKPAETAGRRVDDTDRRTGDGRVSKEELLEFDGTVTEVLPDGNYRVKLDNDHELLAYMSGKMRKFRIRTGVGDRVVVEVSPYDLARGRINFRHKDLARPMGSPPTRRQQNFRRR